MAQRINGDLEVLGCVRAHELDGGMGETLQEQMRQLCETIATAVAAKENESIREKLAEIEQVFFLQAEQYNAAVRQYNAAVETINRLSERLTALEANYDPTII